MRKDRVRAVAIYTQGIKVGDRHQCHRTWYWPPSTFAFKSDVHMYIIYFYNKSAELINTTCTVQKRINHGIREYPGQVPTHRIQAPQLLLYSWFLHTLHTCDQLTMVIYHVGRLPHESKQLYLILSHRFRVTVLKRNRFRSQCESAGFCV